MHISTEDFIFHRIPGLQFSKILKHVKLITETKLTKESRKHRAHAALQFAERQGWVCSAISETRLSFYIAIYLHDRPQW